jgi:hypothetical protein
MQLLLREKMRVPARWQIVTVYSPRNLMWINRQTVDPLQ